MLALAVGSGLGRYHGSFAGFPQFGSAFTSVIHPPPDAQPVSPTGYDGQFFYVQALDPLLLHDSTVNTLRATGAAFRMERMAYPTLAFLLAGGQREAIPFALMATNVLVLLSLTLGFAVYALRRGWSPMWAVAIALMPGMLLAALRDLSDPLALAATVAGLLLWRHGRSWPAALALTLAVLSREVMMLAVIAVAADAAVSAWAQRDWRRNARRVWPVIIVPTLALAVWQGYVALRYGGPVGGANLDPPLVNLVQELKGSFARGISPMAIWDAAYVALILAGSVVAFGSLRHGVGVTAAAAAALALGVLIPVLGDVWSDTRLSAPMFVLLLIAGLERGDRWSIRIAALAAAMTFLIPVAIPGAF